MIVPTDSVVELNGPDSILEVVSNVTTNKSTTWLTASTTTAVSVLNQTHKRAQQQGQIWLRAALPTREHSAFGGIRSLLVQLIPLAQREMPELIVACAPELAALLPDQAATLLNGVLPLAQRVQMPLGQARMLPRESEYVFRIVLRLGWFFEQIGRWYVESHGQPPLIVVPSLDQADRPTLLLVYHLAQRLPSGAFRLLLSSAWLPGDDPPLDRRGLFDAEYERRQFLASIYKHVAVTTIRSAREADASDALDLPAGDDEEARAQRATLQADADARAAAVTRAIELSTLFFNPEAVLALVGAVLDKPDSVDGRDVELWQAAGIAHATLGNYPEAASCFQRGFEQTNEPVVRARMNMFRALVAAKRLNALDEATALLVEGYGAIEGLETPAALLERGWLNNLKALVAYRCQEHAQALRLTQSALSFTKPNRSDEAVGLKTNLVANISFVFEKVGKYERSLKMWIVFRTLLGESNPVFAKYYYFREAGLRIKAGQPHEAAQSYQMAFDLAERISDVVTMVTAAQAGVQLAYRTGNYATAQSWAEQLPGLLAQLGDYRGLWRSWVTVAACRAMQRDHVGAFEAIAEAAAISAWSASAEEHATLDQLSAELQTPDARIDWTDWLPDLPPTTLRQPVRLFVP